MFFEVHKKIIAFWDVMSCSVIKVYRRYSETSVNFSHPHMASSHMMAVRTSDLARLPEFIVSKREVWANLASAQEFLFKQVWHNAALTRAAHFLFTKLCRVTS